MGVDRELRDEVRARYAEAARAAGQGGGCGCGCGCSVDAGEGFGAELYMGTGDAVPAGAVAASLGCGVPTSTLALKPGDVVLDLGSGAGLDVILSARRVAPGGRAIGLDMTDEMLALARRHAAEARVANAEFVKGHIEDVPLPDQSVDAVISNCVVNLSTDKARVLAEIARVLRPGGRVGLSDVVAEDHLTPADRAERGTHTGCIAGALSVAEYEQGLAAVGLEDVRVTLTHPVADGMHAATVQATKAAR